MTKFFPFIFLFFVFFTSCTKKNENTTPQKNTTTGTSTTSTNCPTCSFPDTIYTNTVSSGPKLVLVFAIDSNQIRLNNLGQPTVVTTGNAAQSPSFNCISSHYVELAKSDSVAVGSGAVLYHAPETTCGGSNAIIFCQSVLVKNGQVFLTYPLNQIAAGSYKWLRVSLAYQNYDIVIKTNSTGPIIGTIGSFVGFNTYVTKYMMKNTVFTPTASGGPGNHLQGYWGFYTNYLSVNYMLDGQAPQTTVVNPLFATSPIPAGSCLATGLFVSTTNTSVSAPLIIPSNPTSDITVTVSLSSNKSFEWKEVNFDGLFQPDIGEQVVDMGIRGVLAKH
ncbi:MAG: hypothetical protein JSU07_01855 [Bacteroidetes bacterium]|nr:hypothetical protein [Bacteroidota bacterium]